MTMNELPKCRLCGGAPHHYRSGYAECDTAGCAMRGVVMTDDDWRRLHGPRGLITSASLGAALVRHGVIDESAIDDPDGYDGGHTVDALAMAARELAGPRLAPEHLDVLRNLADDPGIACIESEAVRAALAALGEE